MEIISHVKQEHGNSISFLIKYFIEYLLLRVQSLSWAWGLMPLILALRSQRNESHCKFKASPVYEAKKKKGSLYIKLISAIK